MKKRDKKQVKRYIQICPKCKSPDVNMDKSNPIQPAYGLPALYICGNCDHTGYTFPEVELDKIEGFEKEVDKLQLRKTKEPATEQVDRTYGMDAHSFLEWLVSKYHFYLPRHPSVHSNSPRSFSS